MLCYLKSFRFNVQIFAAVVLTALVAAAVYAGVDWLGTNYYRPASVTIIDQDKKYDAAKLKADLEKTKWAYPAELVVYVGKTPKLPYQPIPREDDNDTGDGLLSNFFLAYPKYGYGYPRPGVVVLYYDTQRNYCALRDSVGREDRFITLPEAKDMAYFCAKGNLTEPLIAAGFKKLGERDLTGYNFSTSVKIFFTILFTLLAFPLIRFLVSHIHLPSRRLEETAEEKPEKDGSVASEKEKQASEYETKQYWYPSKNAFYGWVSVLLVLPIIVGFMAAMIHYRNLPKIINGNDVYLKAPEYLKGATDELGTADAGELYHPKAVYISAGKEYIENPKALKESLSKLGFTKKITLDIVIYDGFHAANMESFYKNLDDVIWKEGDPFKSYGGAVGGLQTPEGVETLFYIPCANSFGDCAGVYKRFYELGSTWPKEYPSEINSKEKKRIDRAYGFLNFRNYTAWMNLSALAKPVDKNHKLYLDRAIWETAVGLANTERGVMDWNVGALKERGKLLEVFVSASVKTAPVSLLLMLILWGWYRYKENKYRDVYIADRPVQAVGAGLLLVVAGFATANYVSHTIFPTFEANQPNEEHSIPIDNSRQYHPASVTVRDPKGILDVAEVKAVAEKAKYPAPFNVLITTQDIDDNMAGIPENAKFFEGVPMLKDSWWQVRNGTKDLYDTLSPTGVEKDFEGSSTVNKFTYSLADLNPRTLIICVYKNSDGKVYILSPELATASLYHRGDAERKDFQMAKNPTREQITQRLEKILTGKKARVGLFRGNN